MAAGGHMENDVHTKTLNSDLISRAGPSPSRGVCAVLSRLPDASNLMLPLR